MINVNEKYKCSGCHACYNICPQNAIEMIEDEKGFKYPRVNKDKCVNCSLCEKVCPIFNNKKTENEPKVYACYNKDEKIRMKSSSGGIFTLIAEEIIKKDGVVCGAAFDEQYRLFHQFVENIEDLDKLRTSKYLQSTIDDTYKKTKEYLENDRCVLFTGTPCQIEGLISYLGKKYDKLYTQDIICHGVPSPKVWKKYMKYRKEVDNKIPQKINFRDKKQQGWHLFSLSFNYGDTEYAKNQTEDIFLRAFLADVCLRDSCYQCSFRKQNRISDITLADYWGIENVLPEMDDNKGTSLVLVNSQKGMELMNKIKSNIVYKEVTINDAIISNRALIKSPETNKYREKFFNELDSREFDELVKKYVRKKSIIVRIKNKIKRTINKILNKD